MQNAKPVVTRKEHRCAGCNRKMPAGTKMLSWQFLDTGGNGWATWHICPVCEAVMNEVECADWDGTYYEEFAINTDRELWKKRCAEIELRNSVDANKMEDKP